MDNVLILRPQARKGKWMEHISKDYARHFAQVLIGQ